VLDVVAAFHLPVGVLGSLVPLILLLAWIAPRRALDLGPLRRPVRRIGATAGETARLPAGWPHWSPR